MSALRTMAEFSTGVVQWRREQLLTAGFPSRLAAALAADATVDLHEVLALVDRGCPPTIAARILAPMDGWGRWSS